jgi:prepilin-type N-terminal cleavage/methylation domain-containing protein
VSLRTSFAAVRSEEGFGLVELLIAMTILAIGIGATLAVFSSSIISLRHASRAGTALTLAERQLEAYRAMPYVCVPRGGSIARPPAPACSAAPAYSGFPDPYASTQSVSGAEAPDHLSYTVTTAVSSSTTNPQITVTVAQSSAPSTALATESSYFSDAGTAPTTG